MIAVLVFILCTALLYPSSSVFTSGTYPPRTPGTLFAVRYYSTELAPDMEEEDDDDF